MRLKTKERGKNMKEIKKTVSRLVMLLVSVLCLLAVGVSAEDYSDDSSSGDNSLYSLGLENAVSCEPEFYYATLEYNVTVSADTKELLLDPVKSADSAEIIDISGTQLSDDGTGTVSITVQAANGAAATYVLHVTSEAGAISEKETETEDAAAKAEAEAKAESEKLAAESEAVAQSEAAAQLEQKTQQVTALQKENDDFANRLDKLMKILYGLIAFAVILLFVIINQTLRNKDMKDEIKTLKGQVTESYEYARKEQNMRSDYYYAPVQNTPQQPVNNNMQMNEMSGNVHAAFGNASQKLQAQPMNITAAASEAAPALSKKELKRQEKEAKRAAKREKNKASMQQEEIAQQTPPMQQPVSSQPVQPQQPMQAQQQPMQAQPQQPVQPTMVQSSIEEPDVNVDMIDL